MGFFFFFLGRMITYCVYWNQQFCSLHEQLISGIGFVGTAVSVSRSSQL